MRTKKFAAVTALIAISSFSFGDAAHASGFYRLLPDSEYIDSLGPNVVGNALRFGRSLRGSMRLRGVRSITTPLSAPAATPASRYSDVSSDSR